MYYLSHYICAYKEVFYDMPYQTLLISLGKHQELATKDGFASKAVKISCVMAISWCILELLGRNPDWLLFNMLPISKIS